MHVVEVIRAGWPALRSMPSGYDISATTPVPIDGAFPEPDRLCAPMLPSTAKKTVDVQTCKGFATVAASFATGPALRAFGAIRGGASRAQPARLRAEVLRASSVATSAIENGRFAHALSAEVPLRPDTRFQPSLTTGRWHFLYLVNSLRDS